MQTNGGAAREVAVPISLFPALRRELEEEVGTLPTVHALHRAGYEAGIQASGPLRAETGGASHASPAAFWSALGAYFARRGWGTLSHRTVHEAVGMLSSPDWAEASGAGEPDPDGSCCFSTGFLSGLLTQVAGGPVAVLEVDCRTRGDATCDFAFGSEAVIHELYGQLLEGGDLLAALSAL